MAKTLNEWARDIHQNAVEHGWWDEPRSFGDIVALCHSELSEALEEYRNGKPMIYGCCGHCDKETQCEVDGKPEHSCKPEGVAVELCDAVMRIMDFLAQRVQADGGDAELHNSGLYLREVENFIDELQQTFVVGFHNVVIFFALFRIFAFGNDT